jgi:hypothetical protein
MFDACTTGDTAHIDTIFMFLPHTRQHGCIDFLQFSVFQFSCGCEQFHYSRSFCFLVINVCNHGEHYETPVLLCGKIFGILAERERSYKSVNMARWTEGCCYDAHYGCKTQRGQTTNRSECEMYLIPALLKVQ